VPAAENPASNREPFRVHTRVRARGHHQPADRRVARAHPVEVRAGHHRREARPADQRLLQLGEGLLEYVGPLVETAPQEKPLSIALREINTDLIEFKPAEAEATT